MHCPVLLYTLYVTEYIVRS